MGKLPSNTGAFIFIIGKTKASWKQYYIAKMQRNLISTKNLGISNVVLKTVAVNLDIGEPHLKGTNFKFL